MALLLTCAGGFAQLGGSVHSLSISGGPYAVAALGSSMVVTTLTTSDGLAVVDVANPATPTVLGSVTSTQLGGARGVAMSSDARYAFVAAYNADRLTVVDVSTPAAPVVAGSVASTQNLNGAIAVATSYVSASHVYVVAQASNKLTVVDVSSPANPTIAGVAYQKHFGLSGARSVAVHSVRAFIASTGNDRLHVVDVADPTNPAFAGTLYSLSFDQAYAVAVASSGRYAYVASYSRNSVVTVDVAISSNMSVVGSCANTTHLNSPSALRLVGGNAYVVSTAPSGGTIVSLVDVSIPSAPVLTQSSEMPSVLQGTGLTSINDVLFAASDGLLTSLVALQAPSPQI